MEGGVKIAFSREEVGTYASNILGSILVTIQTGDEGKLVRNLYVNLAAPSRTNTTSPFSWTVRPNRCSSWRPLRWDGH